MSEKLNLFKTGFVRLHSGQQSSFKIDCDALSDEDISSIALQLTIRLPMFYEVEGVPQGGLRLAKAMEKFIVPFQPIRSDKLLIVDDVFTTGASMEEHRANRRAIGAVIFARTNTPDWITPLFRMEP